MATITEQLEAAWSSWWNFLNSNKPWETDPDNCRRIHERLTRFSEAHKNEPDYIDAVIGALSKGKHLLEAAVRWALPSAGGKDEGKGTTTDCVRGDQWRLVMAHGGMETVLGALAPGVSSDVGRRREMLLQLAGLTQYEPLPSPRRDRVEVERWLSASEDNGGNRYLRLLGLNGTDREVLHDWLLQGKTIETWTAALKLAKALRNATAHGALSASQAYRLGLRPTFQRLGTDLGQVVAGALARLGD